MGFQQPESVRVQYFWSGTFRGKCICKGAKCIQLSKGIVDSKSAVQVSTFDAVNEVRKRLSIL